MTSWKLTFFCPLLPYLLPLPYLPPPSLSPSFFPPTPHPLPPPPPSPTSSSKMWDLRYATAPMRVLEQHKRGILSLAWCRQDSDLLLSAAKDNRVLCWNPNSDLTGGEVSIEFCIICSGVILCSGVIATST